MLRLQECLSKYQRTDVGNTPQVCTTLTTYSALVFFNWHLHRLKIGEETQLLYELYEVVDCLKLFPSPILQVDLVHLLASRDQELRALSAEVIICTILSKAAIFHELARHVPKVKSPVSGHLKGNAYMNLLHRVYIFFAN